MQIAKKIFFMEELKLEDGLKHFENPSYDLCLWFAEILFLVTTKEHFSIVPQLGIHLHCRLERGKEQSVHL